MAEQYADRRGPLITVMWPGYEHCDDEPLVGIFHSSYDGTAQFEFVGTSLAADESEFPEFLHDFADALQRYQVNSLLEQIEDAETKRAEAHESSRDIESP